MKNKIAISIIATIIIIGLIILNTKTIKEKGIQLWDQVTIQYQATLPDGRIFQSGEETITIGEDTILWLDNHLLWLQTGNTKTTIISPNEWYGQFYNPTLVQRMPIYTLTQAGISPEAETFILFGWTRYYIQKIENDIATLDSNAAHTRQDLTYDITILNIQNQTEDK